MQLRALVVVVVVLLVAARASAQAPDAPTPIVEAPGAAAKPVVVILDDRDVKDQAPPAFVARVAEELARRKMTVVRLTEARKKLSAKADKALAACVDDAGCLANAGRAAGGDLVVTVRLTKREGAFFLAVTRVNALRPQLTDDAGTLSGTDADALAAVPEAVAEIFPAKG